LKGFLENLRLFNREKVRMERQRWLDLATKDDIEPFKEKNGKRLLKNLSQVLYSKNTVFFEELKAIKNLSIGKLFSAFKTLSQTSNIQEEQAESLKNLIATQEQMIKVQKQTLIDLTKSLISKNQEQMNRNNEELAILKQKK
jgi:hypothetical protein